MRNSLTTPAAHQNSSADLGQTLPLRGRQLILDSLAGGGEVTRVSPVWLSCSSWDPWEPAHPWHGEGGGQEH